MNPSLPGLPVTPSGSGVSPGDATKFNSNQSDSGPSGGFEGLLGEAYTAQSSAVQGSPTQSAEAQSPSGELQSLPQDGKLLPLLQQTLDRLTDAGLDPQQFVERLNARLKTLAENTRLQPAEQLAVALQQMIQEQPALKSVLSGEALDLLAGNRSVQQALVAGSNGAVSNDPADHVRRMVASDPDRALADSFKLAQSAQNQQAKTVAVDNTLTSLQQQAAASGTGQPELATLVAALKRMAMDKRPATAPVDNIQRPELAASGATSSALTATTAATTPAASGTATVSLATPFGQAGWDQALGERIQWLAGQKVQAAQVRLNPANLGPMEVRIQVHNDQASVQFTAHHAVVREALEAAMPRLRDMFEASGVQLVDVDVSSGESFTGQQQALHDPQKPHINNGNEAAEPGSDVRLETPLAGFIPRGYLDLFA